MSKNSASFSFPALSFRHLESPFQKQGYRDYYAVVDCRYLPDLRRWREINIRDPKLRGAVPTAIRNGFRDKPDLFVFMNRGLVIAAEEVVYDNKTGNITLTLTKPLLHGLLDGGHSYDIIRMESQGLDNPRYVKVEFLTGFSGDDITNVVDARNTSNQVKDESLMNLAGTFDDLKDALRKAPYFNNIAWKEYETDTSGDPLPIDVREVISILMCFDKTNFRDAAHPINAYRSKQAALQHFKEHQKDFEKLYLIADDLLRLYDEIYLALPDLYNKARRSDDVAGGRFGRLTGVTVYKKGEATLPFIQKESGYGVPSGFIYPILGAFRSLLVEKRGRFVWAPNVDPFKLLASDVGREVANVLGNFALEHQNPSKVGKSPTVWQSCYNQVRLSYFDLRDQVAKTA